MGILTPACLTNLALRCLLLPCACVRVHRVCASEGRNVAVLLDLEGGTVRSSFLIDHATKKRISKIELKVRWIGRGACLASAC